MQKLIEHISELLYLHDCVIIPDFGGFICNQKCADIQEGSGIILPPTKDILFNRNLTHNDGLLLNWIAQKEGISYDKAATKLALFSEELKVRLYQKEKIAFGDIGTFYIDRHFNIIFEPTQHNFLAASYGMESLSIPFWTAPQTNSSTTESPCINIESSGHMLHRFLKYGLAAAAIAGIIFVTQSDIYPQVKEQWNKISNQTAIQSVFTQSSRQTNDEITCNCVISPIQDYVEYDPINDLASDSSTLE